MLRGVDAVWVLTVAPSHSSGLRVPCFPGMLASLKGLRFIHNIYPGPEESHFKITEGRVVD